MHQVEGMHQRHYYYYYMNLKFALFFIFYLFDIICFGIGIIRPLALLLDWSPEDNFTSGAFNPNGSEAPPPLNDSGGINWSSGGLFVLFSFGFGFSFGLIVLDPIA